MRMTSIDKSETRTPTPTLHTMNAAQLQHNAPLFGTPSAYGAQSQALFQHVLQQQANPAAMDEDKTKGGKVARAGLNPDRLRDELTLLRTLNVPWHLLSLRAQDALLQEYWDYYDRDGKYTCRACGCQSRYHKGVVSGRVVCAAVPNTEDIQRERIIDLCCRPAKDDGKKKTFTDFKADVAAGKASPLRAHNTDVFYTRLHYKALPRKGAAVKAEKAGGSGGPRKAAPVETKSEPVVVAVPPEIPPAAAVDLAHLPLDVKQAIEQVATRLAEQMARQLAQQAVDQVKAEARQAINQVRSDAEKHVAQSRDTVVQAAALEQQKNEDKCRALEEQLQQSNDALKRAAAMVDVIQKGARTCQTPSSTFTAAGTSYFLPVQPKAGSTPYTPLLVVDEEDSVGNTGDDDDDDDDYDPTVVETWSTTDLEEGEVPLVDRRFSARRSSARQSSNTQAKKRDPIDVLVEHKAQEARHRQETNLLQRQQQQQKQQQQPKVFQTPASPSVSFAASYPGLASLYSQS